MYNDLLVKFKKMSLDELQSYDVILRRANGIVNVSGILSLLFILYNPIWYVILPMAFIVLILLDVGISISKLRKEISKNLERFIQS